MTDVWFAIPSANLELCRANLPQWTSQGYRVAVLQDSVRGAVPADVVLQRDTYPGWAESVNILCREAIPTDAAIVVTGGDDMLPDPTRTADELAAEFFDRFPDGFGVMQPIGDDFLNAHEYCGSPWFGRGWIDRAYRGRGPLPGGYRHNWADHELYWVASAYDALWMRDDVTQRHEHFSRTGAEAPEYWHAAAAHDRDDVERFIARMFDGFPGHERIGVPAPSADTWRARYTGLAHRHWASRYGASWLGGDAAQRLAETLTRCQADGLRRVAIAGAGTATRESAAALLEPPVDVVAILDDRTDIVGTTLWGFTVCALTDASLLDVDAIVVHGRGDDSALVARVRSIVEGTTEVRSTSISMPAPITR